MTMNKWKYKKKAKIYNIEVQNKMYNAKKYKEERKIKTENNQIKILYRITIKVFLQWVVRIC